MTISKCNKMPGFDALNVYFPNNPITGYFETCRGLINWYAPRLSTSNNIIDILVMSEKKCLKNTHMGL